jgi:putative flippase GtrA
MNGYPESMPLTPAALLASARTAEGRKFFRYVVVSMISFVVGLTILGVCKGLIRWSAFTSNMASTAVATGPAYVLNRRWAWGKSGKSHLWKEVVPFWVLAFVGLAFSTYWAVFAEHLTKHLNHLQQTAAVEGAVILAYGVLWIGKFMIINKLLFAGHPDDIEPAIDGRSGLPG